MSRSILPLLFIMSFPYQWWQSAQAQSSEMGLLTLAPPASQGATTTDAAAAAAATTPAPTEAATTTAESVAAPATSVVPSILYPMGSPIINNIDTILVSYTSPWDSVDLTVQCQSGSSKQSYGVDSLDPNGTYDLSPVNGDLDFSKFPQTCLIIINDASDTANLIDGGTFTMTNTKGHASIYALAATSAAPTTGLAQFTATADATATTTVQSNKPTHYTMATLAASATSNPAAASSTSSPSTDATSSHSGLSGGAKAGLAIGILLLLALLALLAFYLIRQRRRLQRTEAALASEKSERESEKAYIDNILKVAGKPETSQGGRIVVTNLDSRDGGEDWKSFFASKATSAKNSSKSVGGAVGALIERAKSSASSRRFSMKSGGSKRFSRMSGASSKIGGSRPGTMEHGIPDVPSLPAISLHGSTTNLVKHDY